MGTQSTDLGISNSHYRPEIGAQLYNRYLDEKVYAEQMGLRRRDAQRAPLHALLHCRASPTWARPSWPASPKR